MKIFQPKQKYTMFALLIITIITMMGCRKQIVEMAQTREPDNTQTISTSKLGKQKPNVFSLAIVKKAVEGVLQEKGIIGISQQSTISATHLYIRFAPQNVDQLTLLEESGMVLYDVPLDYDIEVQGDWYQDPAIPEDQITYQYTLVPEDYVLPTHIPYTVMDYIYLYNEDSGEEQEPDDWSGGNDDCLVYDPINGWYIDPNCTPTINPLMQQTAAGQLEPMHIYYKRNGDPVIKATQQLKALGIKPAVLYAMSVKLAGFDPNTESNGIVQHGNYRPKGYIRVYNSDLQAAEPVRGAMVKSRNFFKLDKVYTDNDGYFYMQKKYNRRAHLIVKFRNPLASIRGINGLLKAWQYVFPVKHNLGEYWTSSLEKVDFTFSYSDQPHSDASRKWAAATTMSAITDSYFWNQRDGIESSLPFLNVWITSRFASDAGTPMLQYLTKPIVGTTEATIANYIITQIIDKLLENVLYSDQIHKRVIEKSMPDITLRYGGQYGNATTSSHELYNTSFRTLGRAAHYYSLFKTQQPTGSAASDYWWKHIKYIVNNEINNTNPPYGNKGSEDASRAAVIESWSYYYGNSMTAERYMTGLFGLNPNGPQASMATIDMIEDMLPNNITSIKISTQGFKSWYEGWIPCGMLHDLTDNTENTGFTNVTDNANAYNRLKIYRALTDYTHPTIQSFVSSLLNRSVYLQEAEVLSLKQQYGY